MLKRCKDMNLDLNWEKCHFMCREGIVLGHKILKSGIEVDRAKVDVIAKLPHPTTVKGVRSFLGHAGFYRRYIMSFSTIASPIKLTLLEKEYTRCEYEREARSAFTLAMQDNEEAANTLTTTEKEMLLSLSVFVLVRIAKYSKVCAGKQNSQHDEIAQNAIQFVNFTMYGVLSSWDHLFFSWE
ncbi:hypothetical protein Tco_1039642 [Tanacetum coccineum]